MADTLSFTITPKLEARFWSKVDRRGTDECWPWLGWTSDKGYGRFKIGVRNWLATRVALSLGGQWPAAGCVAMHSCDNPRCNNPSHLRWGTIDENNRDRDEKGRAVHLRGESHPHAKLTTALVEYIRTSEKSAKAIARELGMSHSPVLAARRGYVWKHVETPPPSPRPKKPPKPIIGQRRGESIWKAKLTESRVRQIRSATGSNIDLAAAFGVDATTISRVRNRKAWAHVI